MKNPIIIFIIIYVVLVKQSTGWFSINNKFQSNSYVDYREIFVGNYFCKVTSTTFQALEKANLTQDTVTISITKSSIDSLLLVRIKDMNYEFKLKSSFLLSNSHKGKFFGKDSVFLNISTGHASYKNFIGKKLFYKN